MYAVFGATGHTGRVVADTLLGQGEAVRVVVRSRSRGERFAALGAQVVVANLDDPESLGAAFYGVRGAYLLLPPRNASHSPRADNVRAAQHLALTVAANRVPHVVLLSSMGAHLPAGTGPITALHRAETLLTAGPATVTVLRSAWFMENAALSMALLGNGLLPSFLRPDLPLDMVSIKDVGRVAAASLVEGGHGNTVIELKGPRAFTQQEVAEEFARLMRRPVAVQSQPESAIIPTLTDLGMSADAAALQAEMFHALNAGTLTWQAGLTRQIRGRVTLSEVLKGLLSA